MLRGRHLLSHTSGLTYDFSAPGLQKYLKSVGEDVEFSVLLKSYLMGKLVGLNECAAPTLQVANTY